MLNIAWHVLGRAGGRVSPGQAKNNNGLALHHVSDLKGVRPHGATGGFFFNKLVKRDIGQCLPYLDGHSFFSRKRVPRPGSDLGMGCI